MNDWCGFSRIFLLGILIFKALTARRLYKSFGVKGLSWQWRCHAVSCWSYPITQMHSVSVHPTPLFVPAYCFNGCRHIQVQEICGFLCYFFGSLYVDVFPAMVPKMVHSSGVPRGVQTHSRKFRRFEKAEPNCKLRGKYVRNNLIRIRVSLICKLSRTPD
jgi:hypothetical protein